MSFEKLLINVDDEPEYDEGLQADILNDEVKEPEIKVAPELEYEIDDEKFYPIIGNQIIERFGITDQDGKPITAEDLLENKNLDGLMDMMEMIIENASTPNYHNKLSEEFDDYLKRGGDAHEFMRQFVDSPIPSNVETIEGQKQVVQQFYKQTTKWSDERIAKHIDRLAKDDELEAEAKEQVVFLKQLDDQKKKEFLEKEKQKEAEKEKQQIEYFNNVRHVIRNGSVEELGYNLAKNDRLQLEEYIDKKDASGLTKYQKEVREIKNFDVRLALLVKNGFFEEKNIEKFAKRQTVSDIEKQLKTTVKIKEKSNNQQVSYNSFLK